MSKNEKSKKIYKNSCSIVTSRLFGSAVRTLFLICIILPAEAEADDKKYQPSSADLPSGTPQETSNDTNSINNVTQYNPRTVYKLWLSSVGYPQDKSKNQKQKELLELVEKVRSIKVKKITKQTGKTKSSEPAEHNERETSLPKKNDTEKKVKEKTRPLYSESKISELTLKKLKQFLKQPEKIENPFKLAETFYQSGRITAAGTLYRQALEKNEKSKKISRHDKAWIIFQIANCMRNDNPQLADKMYRKLIQQYPESPWSDLAKARDKLLNWYEKEKPQNLINGNGSKALTKTFDMGASN